MVVRREESDSEGRCLQVLASIKEVTEKMRGIAY
jgi:hypothetical protein